MDSAADTFGPLMGDVAVALLGEPSKKERGGMTLRYGTHGSLKIEVDQGVWHDKEANEGGGVLDLVARERRCDRRGAHQWLQDEGYLANPEPEPSKFYDYRDEQGRTLFRVERRMVGGKKTFRQYGPDGQGGLVSRPGCMAGVRLVPYRLPELLAAETNSIVFVCEGEKDVDRLISLGLVATTNPGGAGKFSAEFAPAFAGRRVAILEDNDQAGRDHAADVLAKLRGAAEAVAIVRLPGLPDKGDVSDWLSNSGSAFQLVQQFAEPALAAGAEADLLPSLDLVELAGLRAKPTTFAVERVFPDGEVSTLNGEGSAGKSLLCQQLATAHAAGLGSCLGLTVSERVAIYLTCEDDVAQLHWRQERICEALDVPMASLDGKLHLVSLRGRLGNELATFANGEMNVTEAFHRMVQTIRARKAGIVYLDNVAHLFAGNENDRSDVTRFVNLLNRLAAKAGCAIVLIGHPNKAGDEWSGSTGWNNAVRSRSWLTSDKVTGVRTWELPKSNYAEKGDLSRFYWHAGAFAREEDLPADTAKQLAETVRASGDNKLFLDCLAERNKQRRHVSEKPTAQNYAPKIFADMPESKGIGRARLVAAMDRLFRVERIERGFIYRDTAEGRDIHGLRDKPEKLRTASENLSENLPRTASENLRKPAENDRKHTPIYKYILGAASAAAAPEYENDDGEGAE